MGKQELSEQSRSQNEDVILSVNGISKRFCRDLKRSLMYGMQDIASEILGLRGNKIDTLRPKEFWALKDVSFEMRRGEALGLIGKNGSGKSTLLRVIAGLIKPDTGSVEVQGRIAPLIALGAGFNPILTGRENIYANMSILGLSKAEIDEQFEAVLDFAEIGDAIDSPVQTYSSGMAARLGFASAIHTEPDILLIDEVLAVGDVKFRMKCYRKLGELRKKGTSFILVSHAPQSIIAMCDRAVYLQKGELVLQGETSTVMRKYESDLFSGETLETAGALFLPKKPESESHGLDILSLHFEDASGRRIQHPKTSETVRLCVRCKADRSFSQIILTVIIREVLGDGEGVLFLTNQQDQQYLDIPSGEAEIQMEMPFCGLRPNQYVMKLHLSEKNLYMYDMVESFRFSVESSKDVSQCLFYQPRQWSVTNHQS
jgi:lipopolysaccharide transport system ATP-binding protein